MNLDEVTPPEESKENDENETRMCGDCLGLSKAHCVYCGDTGRVLTQRARMLRQQRAERLANAAPALYEACRHALAVRVADVGRCDHEAIYAEDCLQCELRAALALVDGPQKD